MHDKRGNRPASSSKPRLTEEQRHRIERARKFGAIPSEDIPAVMGSPDNPAFAYGLALAEAQFHVGELLAVIYELPGGTPSATRLRRLADELAAALSVWAARDEDAPQPEARLAANTAMDAIDVMIAELHAARRALTGETRAADDATAARVDELLRRRGGER